MGGAEAFCEGGGAEARCSFLSAATASLTGLRTLFATVASWETTLSTLLSGGGAGEEGVELEGGVELEAGEVAAL